MKGQICIATLMVVFAIPAVADHHGPLIEEALSAAPPVITNPTISVAIQIL